MVKRTQLNKNDVEILTSYLTEAGNAALSALKLCRAGIAAGGPGDDDGVERLVAVEAMLEKTGYLMDRGLNLLGDPGVVGSYDNWLAGECEDVEAESRRAAA